MRAVRFWILFLMLAGAGASAPETMGQVSVGYPAEGTVFPPDLDTPTFEWREETGGATRWRVEVRFSDGGSLARTVAGEPMKVGEIDARCVGPTNELPRLTAEQASAHTWKPEPAAWAEVRRRATCDGDDYGTEGRPGGVAGSGAVHDLKRSGGSADLLPGRAADAVADGEGRDQAAGAEADAAAEMAAALCGRSAEPDGARRDAHLRQLPLVFKGWPDAGHGPGRAAQRQGAVRDCAGAAADDDPARGRDFVEEGPQPDGAGQADRLHVAGVAGWAAGDDSDPGAILRRELQGLSLPAGLLSDAGDPGLVRPGG